MLDLVKREARRILTARQIIRVAGVCDLCGDPERDSIQDDILKITLIGRDGIENDLILCNLHEGILLQRLLGSYVKRMSCKPVRRDKKMGFKGQIPKELPLEQDENIPSLIEQKLLKGTVDKPEDELPVV